MFKGLVRKIKAKIYEFFVKFDESMESRYDAKIKQAEEQLTKIETRLKRNPSQDYQALATSFEALTKTTEEFDRQRKHMILYIEAQFPEMTSQFTTIEEAVEYLIARYHEIKDNQKEPHGNI